MKSIQQLTASALTEMQERITQATPANTLALLAQAKLRFPQFQTFNDPILENAIIEAARFASELLGDKSPRWLSFVGDSGTGKTFLASAIFYEATNGCEKLSRINHREGAVLSPIRKTFWPKLLSKLREGEYWLVQELAECSFVFLDEIAVEHDPSGFARDKLCELLSRRVKGWTVITSNLTLEKLAELDTRIPSRMIRDGSVVVEMNTQDFSLR